MKILLVGASGAMGQTILQLIQTMDDLEVAAVIQQEAEEKAYPVYTDFQQAQAAFDQGEFKADVVIDFSTSHLTDDLLDFIELSKIPTVLATTGQSAEQIDRIQAVSQHSPILYTQNTSIGVTIMQEAVRLLTEKLYPLNYDIEIIEKHHRYKIDAPSGTAELIRRNAQAVVDEAFEVVAGRQGISEPRQHHQVGVHVIRAGDIVGEHTILFANGDEVLELTHRAGSKKLFANGAISGARFIVTKDKGQYSMADAING